MYIQYEYVTKAYPSLHCTHCAVAHSLRSTDSMLSQTTIRECLGREADATDNEIAANNNSIGVLRRYFSLCSTFPLLFIIFFTSPPTLSNSHLPFSLINTRIPAGWDTTRLAPIQRLRRRVSQEKILSTSVGDTASIFLKNQMPPQPTISLHVNGRARLIFRTDPTWFDGVLIAEDGDETFSITGSPNKVISEDHSRRLVDVSVTDGETGQLYIIRRVDLMPPRSQLEEEMRALDEPHIYKTLSKPHSFKALKEELELGVAIDPASHAAIHESQEVPNYELRSEVLQFSTEEILVGNRADKEIRAYLNPALVGHLLNVHMGPMRISFSAPVTPPATPMGPHRRRSSCHISICGNNIQDTNGNTEEMPETTDADINFLM